jgi:hypothetical protein
MSFRALFFSEIEIGHSVALLVVGARIEGTQRSAAPIWFWSNGLMDG